LPMVMSESLPCRAPAGRALTWSRSRPRGTGGVVLGVGWSCSRAVGGGGRAATLGGAGGSQRNRAARRGEIDKWLVAAAPTGGTGLPSAAARRAPMATASASSHAELRLPSMSKAFGTWHSLRSGLATALKAAGCSDDVIQMICRWANPESLKIYALHGTSLHSIAWTKGQKRL
jgi:hypothetical protein